MRNSDFPFLPKDFVQTVGGLIFAVVSYQQHQQKVGCFLRYVKVDDRWKKVSTEQANQLLQQHYPQYLYQSTQFDAAFHAVAVEDVFVHYRPEQHLQKLLQSGSQDCLHEKLNELVTILVQYGVDCDFLGLTGSMLINQQTTKSDIDLVVYGRENFNKARQAVQLALASGELKMLDRSLMEDNFQRRAGELDFDEFTWHENRKHNKAVIEGSKFDIGMVCLQDASTQDDGHYRKDGIKTIVATIIDDKFAFDFPACYKIDNQDTPEILVYTHTYVGQAKQGEKIEVSGAVEVNISTGNRRLIVGSSREAEGEYIRVCR